MTLLLDLYEVYREIIPVKESFDHFYFWGEMLLKDFDEVDKYLVNGDDLFVSLKNLKEIDARFHFFSEEQKEAIESFWTATLNNPSEDKKHFIGFWHALKPIYRRFRENLRSKGYGYQGMLYRHVLEKTQSGILMEGKEQVIFAGFNALTRVEEDLIKWFIREKKAKIYWDLDAYYFDDPSHEAGLFLRKYNRDQVFRSFFPKKIPKQFQSADKKITTISSSQYPGQARIAGDILKDLLDKGKGGNPENTVIVLPDESLLSSLLYALPDDIDKINITMGYPVTNSSLYNLLEQLIELQAWARRGTKRNWFNHRYVVNILNHPFILDIDRKKCLSLIEKINRFNMVFVPEDLFHDVKSFRELFRAVKDPGELIDYLMKSLIMLRSHFSMEQAESYLFEKEFALVIYKFLNRLNEIFRSRNIELSFELVGRVIRSYARFEKIPFTGEPLQGLQVMGFLETRNLDFENVIMIGVNEGFYPRNSSQSSFIPMNVKKAFQMPTPETQDSIYSYLFYRLLQRARNIYLIYNSEDAYNRKAEPSRYIYQLKLESAHNIGHQILMNDLSIQSRTPVRIFKDAFILNRLERFLTNLRKDREKLTPSMLNLYLNCPLSFCYRYVYDVKEKEEVTEDLDAAKFGLILHKVMESLYKPYDGKTITPALFREIRKGVKDAITFGFAVYHGMEDHLSDFRFEGKNLLGREIIRKFVSKILDYDQHQLPFRIDGLEVSHNLDLPVNLNGQRKSVSLKGIIDRVDSKDGSIRILDYKTGKDFSVFRSIPELFDRSEKNRNKAVFQIFLYSLLFIQNNPGNSLPVVAGLYNFKELHADPFDARIKLKAKSNHPPQPIEDIRPWMKEFQSHLTGLIQEIFDPSIPFQHPQDKKDCIYCSLLGAPSGLS
jgi:hypothetical protein